MEKGENVPSDSDIIAETKSEFEIDAKDEVKGIEVKKREIDKKKKYKETKEEDEKEHTD